MTRFTPMAAILFALIGAPAQSGRVASAGSLAVTDTAKTTQHASGTFKVDVKPADASPIGKSAGLGRMTIDKVWSGGMEGTSQGEMTTTATGPAMVYVALEKFTGKVNGHNGSFVFLHRATMMTNDPASAWMEVTISPNSGTGELAGIAGKLIIVIDKTGHSYDLEYTLP